MTSDVYEDINGALELIKFHFFYNDDAFSKYSSIYPFTNENLNSYLNRINLKNKSVLTVASAGDHYLETLLRGGSKIELFDINILTKYYVELKIAAIKALNYDEFLNFFILENNYYNTFNLDSYNKIRKYLDNNVLIFWDSLYHKYNGNSIRRSKLFFPFEETYEFLKTFISYLEPVNYMCLKNMLLKKNITISNNFSNVNISQLHNTYQKKFDVIFLSNIADYLEEIYKTESTKKFQKHVLTNLSNMLKKDGIIFVAYMFFADSLIQTNIPTINKKKIRENFFSKNFEEWLIDNSAIKNYTSDHLLVYKKK